MNLKDLSKLDIKDLQNIDLSQAKDFLTSRPDILINILLIAVTLFATMYVYNRHSLQSTQIEQQILELTEKTEIVDEQKKTNTALGLVQKSIDSLVKAIGKNPPLQLASNTGSGA